MRITQSDFNNWWQGPVGIEVRKMLVERQNKLAHITAGGALLTMTPAHYGVVCGRYEEMNNLLEMNFEELMGDK